MYAYIKGVLAIKTPTMAVIETNGIGYAIHISLQTFSRIEDLQEARLWTHLQIKDDSHDIYGFFDEAERDMFRALISVSGIGPNTARIVLSSMTTSETRNAILTDDELAFKRVKGVGPKTAKRILIDLKDKMKKLGGDEIMISPTQTNNTQRQEAFTALTALGFHRNEVQKALNQIAGKLTDDISTEELVKLGLKTLSK